MLACIACAKQEADDGAEERARAATTPSNREAAKSLTSQIKDMVLRFSKGGGSTSSSSSSFRSRSFRRHHSQRQQHGAYTYEDAVHCSNQLGAVTSRPAAGNATKSVKEDQQRRCGGKWTVGVEDDDIVVEEDVEPQEWTAQVEPGVHITFVSLPGGAGNELKRIRFSREMFNKWQAQRWWGENYDRIMELYNVQRYNRQALQTPDRSDDGEGESMWSKVLLTKESPITPAPPATEPIIARSEAHKPPLPAALATSHILPHGLRSPAAAATTTEGASGVKTEAAASVDASRTTISSRDEASVSASNASDLEITEWVEQDEAGVYITIRENGDGTRELRRVRFSRDKFGEVHAKLWWEANRERIQAQYL
ncbi:protein Brevis radix-like 2 [Zingiber officinale]|uniref:BRX domain-containing protein n=1 Tax=Zingiber officinale TaxID=94328 RepID=A0A8J5KI59_ZINOF|nr:protein Brevis radix-like 2 [Zingiber officinale]KAG6480602.1 hypothetical protein ZIOFF_057186 [Zingiber officinale]